ncbi:MAG TPA: hypothetical protein PKO22_09805 [Treponemataceae bacterium]|nr:hypothetical protein [Treponemataceae bacterium]
MDIRNFQAIRDAIVRSFETILDDEYDFLGSRRDLILQERPCLERLLSRIESRLVLDPSFNPWAGFCVSLDDKGYSPSSRHRTVSLNVAPPRSVGVVHGTFDPFHLGHLIMGLDAIADGSCDLIVYMPNSDRSAGGSSVKPNKSAHPWRMRTVLSGGADDFFPLTRVSTFAREGDLARAYGRLVDANREIVEGPSGLDIVIIIGSDIVLRPDFIEWSNPAYARIAALAPGGGLRLRFRVVERGGHSASADGRAVRDILRDFDFPHEIVSEVSGASSSSIKQDCASAVYLYPREISLLEAFLLYSPDAGARA